MGAKRYHGHATYCGDESSYRSRFFHAFCYLYRMLIPHDRPFVDGFGYAFMSHAPDSSFPSDHGTAIFTFALAFLFWHHLWSGVSLMFIAIAIAWSRIYLGVHWPFDMLGAFLLGIVGCLFAQLVWNLFGEIIASTTKRFYHMSFALPISKGWVRG